MLNLQNIITKTLDEVRYVDPRTASNENESPIMDNEKIRVYHGLSSMEDAKKVLENGLSGGVRANRRYSYEFANNPKGLFVTIDLDVAKEFGGGGVIIEFTTSVSDLEAPVWKGGDYFVQGQYTKQFKDDEDRESERMSQRELGDKSEDPRISKSDRSELANTLFNNREKQALYIGDLNPNMIKAVWYNKTLHKDRRVSGEWERYSRKDFLKMMEFSPLPPMDKQSGFYGKFRPSDNFTFKAFNINGKYPVSFLEQLFNKKIDTARSGEGWAPDYYPRQLKQVYKIIDSPEANKVLDMMRQNVDYKQIDDFVKEII